MTFLSRWTTAAQGVNHLTPGAAPSTMNWKTIAAAVAGLVAGLLLPYLCGRELTINFRFHHTLEIPFIKKK